MSSYDDYLKKFDYCVTTKYPDNSVVKIVQIPCMCGCGKLYASFDYSECKKEMTKKQNKIKKWKDRGFNG